MILHLLVFFVSAALWIATLWLAILPLLSGWPDLAIAAAHVIPPVFVTVLGVFVHGRAQRRRAIEAQAREEHAQAERKTAREEALKKHAEEMRNRRFGCDCRVVALSRLGLVSPGPIPDPGQPNVDIRPALLDADDNPPDSPLLDRMAPAIADALFMVYSTCRASLAFPVYVLPPAEIPGEEVLAYVRATQSTLAAELAPEMNAARPLALFLPAADSVPGSLLSLFEVSPDLPGAVILAFDSPLSRMSMDAVEFDDEPDPARVAREQQNGKPSEAVVALLVTNAELPSMLAATSLQPSSGSDGSMTPFWEKAIHAEGWPGILAATSEELRAELHNLPVLGRLHRAAVRQTDTARSGALALTRVLQEAIEQAQINAGLIVPSFVHEEESVDAGQQKEPHPGGRHCEAIVHNAGSVEIAGKRLAALGSALYYFGTDLSPVDPDASLNVVTRIGDMGRASGLAQLALALACTAQKSAPALCADFMQDGAVAASFIVPAGFGQADQ